MPGVVQRHVQQDPGGPAGGRGCFQLLGRSAGEEPVDERDGVAGVGIGGSAVGGSAVVAQQGGQPLPVLRAADRPAAVERAGLHLHAQGGKLPGEGGVVDVAAGVVAHVAGHHQAEPEAVRLDGVP